MPQIITCRDCGRKLRVPDNLLGKKVKCPGCGVKFAAEVEEELEEWDEVEEPAPPPPRRSRDEGIQKKQPKSRPRDYEEEEEEEDVSAKRKRRDDDEDDDEDYEPQKRKPKKREIYKGWERVRLGVNLVAVSIWIMIGGFAALILSSCVLGAVIGAAAAPAGGAPNGPFNQAPPGGAVAGASVAVIAIAALMVILYLAYTGTQMTGLGFCMGVVSTPRTQSLKMLAVTSFGLAVAGLCANGLSYAAGFILGPKAPFIAQGLSWLETVLYLAEFTCFLFFMRGVALVMRKDDLARAIVVYMITLAVIIGLSVIAYFILLFAGMAAAVMATPTPGAMRGAGQNVGGYIIVSCAGFLLAAGVSLAMFIRFVLLLYQVRSAVDRWLDRN
jgi:hypothetical protein